MRRVLHKGPSHGQPWIPPVFVTDVVILAFYVALCALPFYGSNYLDSLYGEPNYLSYLLDVQLEFSFISNLFTIYEFQPTYVFI